MTVAHIEIGWTKTSAYTQYLDSGMSNARSAPPYTDGYVQHTLPEGSNISLNFVVDEGGTVDLVIGTEIDTTVTVSENIYFVRVGVVGTSPPLESYEISSYALGHDSASGGSVVITYAYEAAENEPVVTTDAAVGILLQSAVLSGTLSDMGDYTGLSVYFNYGLSGGSLDSSTTAETVSSTGSFDFNVTSLSPSTAYEYEAVVTDGVTVWTATLTQTFTTSALSSDPVIATWGSQVVTDASAVLIGLLSEMGGNSSLDVYFEYGTTTGYGSTTATQTILADDDNAFPDPTGRFTAQITGLTAETKYYFRAVVTDGASAWYPEGAYFAYKVFVTSEVGSGESADIGGYLVELGQAEEAHQTVTGTSGKPEPYTTYFVAVGTAAEYNETGLEECQLRRCRVQYYTVGGTYSDWSDWLEAQTLGAECGLSVLLVDTDPVTSIGNTTATLNGELTDLAAYSAADVFFKIWVKDDNDDYSLVTTTTSEELVATGTFDSNVTGLERNTTYYSQAFAQAEGEQAEGEKVLFVTGGMVVNTLAADDITTSTATINGELVSLDGNASLDVYFEWGYNLETTTTAETKTSLGAFDSALTDLEPNTEYIFCAAATDGTDIWYGETLSFTTLLGVVVKTFYPVDLTSSSATLQGSVNSSLASVDWYFEWGFSTAYGNITALTEILETDGAEAVSAGITGLTGGAVYHCRCVAVDDTTSPSTYYYGNDVRFVLYGGGPEDGGSDGGGLPGDPYDSPDTTGIEDHTEGLWLWDVTPSDGSDTLYWSTRAVAANGNTYTRTVIPTTFRGVESRLSFGSGLLSSSDLAFEIYFDTTAAMENVLSILEGSEVLITLVQGEGVAAYIGKRWRFVVERATFRYGTIKCYLKSVLQYKLVGDWPNTPNPKTVWPSSDPDPYPNYCVPEIFGMAYLPIKSAWMGSRAYVLGESGTNYVVEKVKAPRVRGNSEWFGFEYDFNVSNNAGYAVATFLIDESVSPPANGIWIQGATILMPFAKYYCTATKNITNPAFWIARILIDMGIKPTYIDFWGQGSSFYTAKTVYDNRGLVWQGGFWEKQSREAVLSSLLAMCDSFLYEGNKIELHPFSNYNHSFFDKTIENTFQINPVMVRQDDGGTVLWPAVDAPQDDLPGQALVGTDPVSSTADSPNKMPFKYRFHASSVHAQRAGMLYFQKHHIKNRVSFTTSVLDMDDIGTMIPGKVITLYNPMIFRMSGGVVITKMKFNYDLTVEVDAIELTNMNQWDDLEGVFSVIPVTVDDSEDNMSEAT